MKNNKFLKKDILNKLLKGFGKVLSKPQFNHFVTMIKGMLFASKKSISKYSKLSSKHQSSINRFMKSLAVDDEQLQSQQFKTVKKSQTKKQNSYLILDDNIAHHPYEKVIEGTGTHHDHLQKGYSNGHSVFTSGILNNQTFFPLESKIYIKSTDICNISDFKSKIDMAKESFLKIKKELSFSGVLIDSWYASKELLKLIKRNKKFFVVMLKSNRKVNINYKNLNVTQHSENIKEKDFKVVTYKEKKYKIIKKTAYLPEVGKIQLLFSKKYSQTKKKYGKIHFIATNNFDFSAIQILKTYGLRWPIEVNNRDVKQNLGFEKSILRNLVSIKRHFILCNIAQCFISILKLKSPENIQTSGEIQTILKTDYVLELIGKYGLRGEIGLLCAEEITAIF